MKRILLISCILVLIDQMIKIAITSFMSFGDSALIIKNFFSFTLVHNTGAAFSILSTNTFFLILVGILALVLIYIFFIKNDKNTNNFILYGMLIGGIIGNLIDRIFRGYVIDFLDFNIFGYDFPVFNFADILITVSIFFIMVDIIRRDKNEVSSKCE